MRPGASSRSSVACIRPAAMMLSDTAQTPSEFPGLREPIRCTRILNTSPGPRNSAPERPRPWWQTALKAAVTVAARAAGPLDGRGREAAADHRRHGPGDAGADFPPAHGRPLPDDLQVAARAPLQRHRNAALDRGEGLLRLHGVGHVHAHHRGRRRRPHQLQLLGQGADSSDVIAWPKIIERAAGFLAALALRGRGLHPCLSRSTRLDSGLEVAFWLGCAGLVLGTVPFALSFNEGVFNCIHDRLLGSFRDAKIMRKLRQFHASYREYRSHRGELARFFAMTLRGAVLPHRVDLADHPGLGVQVGLLFVADVVPMAILVARLPVGGRRHQRALRGVFALLWGLAGVSAAEGVAPGGAWLILQTVTWLPWWIAEVARGGSFEPESMKPPGSSIR